jgi:hypothetical protein
MAEIRAGRMDWAFFDRLAGVLPRKVDEENNESPLVSLYGLPCKTKFDREYWESALVALAESSAEFGSTPRAVESNPEYAPEVDDSSSTVDSSSAPSPSACLFVGAAHSSRMRRNIRRTILPTVCSVCGVRYGDDL